MLSLITQRPWWQKLILILVFLVFVFASVLPLIITSQAKSWFQQQGLQLKVDKFYFNLFSGYLEIQQLTIAEFKENGEADGDQSLASIDLLQLNIQWLGLFGRHFTIDDFHIDGGKLVVNNTGEQMTVAGIKLPAANDNGQDEKSSPQVEPQWFLRLNSTEVDDFLVQLTWPDWAKTIPISRLMLPEIATSETDSQHDLSLVSEIEESRIELNLNLTVFSLAPKIKGAISINPLQLSWLDTWLSLQSVKLDGKLYTDSQFEIKLAPEFNLSAHGKVNVTDIEFGNPNLSTSLKEGVISEYQVNLDPSMHPVVSVASLELTETRLQQPSVNLQKTSIKTINFNGQNQLDVDSVELNGLEVPNFAMNDAQVIDVKLPELEIESLSLTDFNQLAIQQVQSNRGELNFTIIQKPEDDSPTASEKNSAEDLSASTTDENTGNGFEFAIAQVKLEDYRFTFMDKAIDPEYQLALNDIKVLTQAIDSQSPEKLDFKLDSKLSGEGTLAIKGSGNFLKPPLNNQLTLALRSFDTRYGNYMMPNLTGYRFTQGHLEIDVDAKIKNDVLDAKNKILLFKTQVAPLSEAEAAASQETIGVPLELALSLLSDSDDNIDLDVPLNGPLSDLDVGISDIVGDAVFDAVATAVATYYSPLGMVFGVFKIADYATKVRFDPVEFDFGATALTPKQTAFLADISKIIAEKQEFKLVVCPAMGQIELDHWLAEKQKSTAEAERKTTKSAEQVAQGVTALKALMLQRTEWVKSFLTQKQGLDPQRLIVCELSNEPEKGVSTIRLGM